MINLTEIIESHNFDDLMDEAESLNDSVPDKGRPKDLASSNISLTNLSADLNVLMQYVETEGNMDADKVINKLKLDKAKKLFDGKCQTNESCIHGYCNKNTSYCVCEYGYVTFYVEIKNNTALKKSIDDDSMDMSLCGYEQKKTFNALLISLIGFGLEHFYMGNYKLGFIKLLYLWSVILVLIIHEACCKYNPISELKYCCMTLRFLFIIGLFLWWLFDFLAISQNKYRDKYGIKLS